MRRRRTGLGGATALLLALLAPGPVDAGTRRIEAESGTVDNAFCGDVASDPTNPELMEVSSGHDPSSVYVVFTGDGCSLSVDPGDLARRMVALRIVMTGRSGELCGYFTFSRGAFGRSRLACSADGDWLVVPVATTALAGPFTVTWHVDGATPRWVNVYLDYLEAG